ncbi:hypothetical protein F383_19182 [Gossypium arboreum]|uniref:Uncharacterized protein n=1 Tax=Gossypium arboreum TaxID=29729 RepID=A0A0B0NM07_GOSAR|nr:hypothetical protein F383_19182 [Gossypium arboreum]
MTLASYYVNVISRVSFNIPSGSISNPKIKLTRSQGMIMLKRYSIAKLARGSKDVGAQFTLSN